VKGWLTASKSKEKPVVMVGQVSQAGSVTGRPATPKVAAEPPHSLAQLAPPNPGLHTLQSSLLRPPAWAVVRPVGQESHWAVVVLRSRCCRCLESERQRGRGKAAAEQRVQSARDAVG
jgi:hypothetical protein